VPSIGVNLVLEQILDALDGIACAVDAEHRIIAVGRRRWDRFAVENGAPELRADGIIGRSLFEFVTEADVQKAYRSRAEQVIANGEPAVIFVRYDSPGTAKELRLSIGPLRLGDEPPGLLFQAQIVAETVRGLATFDFNALLRAFARSADLPIVTLCSFCQRVRRPGSRDAEDWISAEEYDRLGGASRAHIRNDICADCDAARFPG
jgi:hypothetical protein